MPWNNGGGVHGRSSFLSLWVQASGCVDTAGSTEGSNRLIPFSGNRTKEEQKNVAIPKDQT